MNEFGNKCKTALKKAGRNQRWLCAEITARTGMYCDQPYISKIFHGHRNPEKIISAITEILEI